MGTAEWLDSAADWQGVLRPPLRWAKAQALLGAHQADAAVALYSNPHQLAWRDASYVMGALHTGIATGDRALVAQAEAALDALDEPPVPALLHRVEQARQEKDVDTPESDHPAGSD